MPRIDHLEVTTVESRLVYGRDHDAADGPRGRTRHVCFRHRNGLVVGPGDVVAVEYEYERPERVRLPTLLVGVHTVERADDGLSR